MSIKTQPTIATGEDMEPIFVLANKHAPTASAALAVLRAECGPQWGLVLTLPKEEIEAPVRCSYKWRDEETMVECQADDPEKDSEWWRFDSIAPGDWE